MDKAKELLRNLIKWEEMSDKQMLLEQYARGIPRNQLMKNWKGYFQTLDQIFNCLLTKESEKMVFIRMTMLSKKQNYEMSTFGGLTAPKIHTRWLNEAEQLALLPHKMCDNGRYANYVETANFVKNSIWNISRLISNLFLFLRRIWAPTHSYPSVNTYFSYFL